MACINDFFSGIEQLGVFRTPRYERALFFNIDFGSAGYIYVPAVPSLVQAVIRKAEECCVADSLLLPDRIALRRDFDEGPFVYWARRDPEKVYSRAYITLGEWLEGSEIIAPLAMAAE